MEQLLEEFESSLYYPIIITLDGTAASGKGTIVKGLRKRLDNRYKTLDAGAMYRAVTFFYKEQEISPNKLAKTQGSLLDRLQEEVKLDLNEKGILYLNGNKLLDEQLRGPSIDPHVGKFSELDDVKRYIVNLQKRIVEESECGWILDGRCMGSAVAPQAQVKFYVDAPVWVRAARRQRDYYDSGKTSYSTREVKIDLQKRDDMDMATNIAPLVKPDDAIDIDSADFSPDAVTQYAFEYVKNRIIEEGKL